MSALDKDLNDTIAAAVNAKVEAAVMVALAGDEVLGRFVSAALTQPVATDRYSREKAPTFLAHTVQKAVQEATRVAIERLVEEAKPEIEQHVRKALRAKLPEVAATLVDGLRSARYGVSVTVLDDGGER